MKLSGTHPRRCPQKLNPAYPVRVSWLDGFGGVQLADFEERKRPRTLRKVERDAAMDRATAFAQQQSQAEIDKHRLMTEKLRAVREARDLKADEQDTA